MDQCDDRTAAPQGITAAPHRWFVGLACSVTLAVVLLYWLVPGARKALYRENQATEWATAVLFLAAAVIGARRLWTVQALWRDPHWLIPGLSLLAMLDEVGWVVFALGIKPPTILGKSVDGLHDFLSVGVTLAGLYAPRWAVLPLMAAAGLCLVASAVRWGRSVLDSAPWRFFIIAAGFGVASQLLDLDVARDHFLTAIEEVLELDGALALVFSAWLLPPGSRTSSSATNTGADPIQRIPRRTK
jgi:hypothetical protein